MNNFNFTKCIISGDGQTIYYLSSHETTIDNITAVTYNISAADCCNVTTIQDISTDLQFCEKLIAELSEKSVQQEDLKEFVMNYLSEI